MKKKATKMEAMKHPPFNLSNLDGQGQNARHMDFLTCLNPCLNPCLNIQFWTAGFFSNCLNLYPLDTPLDTPLDSHNTHTHNNTENPSNLDSLSEGVGVKRFNYG